MSEASLTPQAEKPSQDYLEKRWPGLGRWLLLAPIVLLLLTCCGLSATLGLRSAAPVGARSELQATYSVWEYILFQVLDPQILEEIRQDRPGLPEEIVAIGQNWFGPSATPIPPSPTPSATSTPFPVVTWTNTPIPSPSPTRGTSTPNLTSTPTRTATRPATFPPPIRTATRTATQPPANTAQPSSTGTPTASQTQSIPTLTRTATQSITPSQTLRPTASPTPSPSPTASPSTPITPSPTLLPSSSATSTHTLSPTPTSSQTNTGTPTVTATATSTPTQTSTSTETATPTETSTITPTPTNTATPTSTPTVTPTPTGTPEPCQPYFPPGEPNIGAPNGVFATLGCGTYIVLDLVAMGYSPIDTTNPDPNNDLVFYERETPSDPGNIAFDWVSAQIGDGPSGDCASGNWTTVLNWGDGDPTNNGHLGGSYPENDNQLVPFGDLIGPPGLQTGIGIDLDSFIPNGTYSCIRINSPFNWPDNDGSEVDALEILNP